LVEAPPKGRDGAVVVQVWREVKETLGERLGSRRKDTQEHNQDQRTVIVNDLPFAASDKLSN